MTDVLEATEELHGWNHSMCDRCWTILRGSTIPCRVLFSPTQICCWCGRDHNSGIFLRVRPGSEVIAWCPDRTGATPSIFFSQL